MEEAPRLGGDDEHARLPPHVEDVEGALRRLGHRVLEAALGVLQEKILKRKVALEALDPQKAQPAGGQTWRQLIKLKEGVEQEKAKEIVKFIKGSKIKVQASIQGDLVRVSGKKKDELQETIALLRGKTFELPLQFVNFRE